MPPRFFVDQALSAGASVALPADVAHHATRVLRLRDGSAVVLFNGRGGEYRALLEVAGASAVARIDGFDPIERSKPVQAEIACWNGWAEFYRKNAKVEQAEIARLNGLAESYGVETNHSLWVEAAEIARWNGMARSYQAAENAEIARLNGLAHFYQTGELSSGRAEQAEIARMKGLAESYRLQQEAHSRAEAAYIARFNGLARS